MTKPHTSDANGQFMAVAIANFIPLDQCCNTTASPSVSVSACSSTVPNAAVSAASTPSPLPIFVGDHLRVICSHGQWCYGHKVADSSNGGDAKTAAVTTPKVGQGGDGAGQQQQQAKQYSCCGIFPRSHVRPMKKQRQNVVRKKDDKPTEDSSGNSNWKNDEALELVAEITETAKKWWKCTKNLYGAVNSSNSSSCEEHIGRIRELMALRRRLRSGTVPTEELRELRLGVARLLDVGNAALHLPMHIRDNTGRTMRTDDLSVIASCRLHEEANARIAARQQQQHLQKQQPLHTVLQSPTTEYTVVALVDKLLAQPAGGQHRQLLLTIEHPQQQQQIGSGGIMELVLGLGHKTATTVVGGSTRPISEPLTIFLDRKMAKCRPPSRALFVDLAKNDVADEQNGLTLWATALRVGPLSGIGTLGRLGTTSEDVRQFYAHGQLDIGELCWDMAEKEQREFALTMLKKTDPPLPAICRQFPAGSSAAVPYLSAAAVANPNSSAVGGGGSASDKICLRGTIQRLSCATTTTTTASSACQNVQILRMLKSCDDGAGADGAVSATAAAGVVVDGVPSTRRNEVFIWLRSVDLHGVGKSEKTVEASISVVDDEGVFQPEAIEIVTPEGVRHQSTFRCRVWFSEDRPKLNELIKIRLPDIEVRNLHLQLLFFNKLTGGGGDKKLGGGPSPFSAPGGGPAGAKGGGGPFALSFLRLINNFVLCEEDEDELLVYKIEKRSLTSSSGPKASSVLSNESDGGGTRPISVAYLGQWATRKEQHQQQQQLLQLPRSRAMSSTAGTIGGTLGRHNNDGQISSSSSLNVSIAAGGGPYTLQTDKSNGVQFVSFVNSVLHTTNAVLSQIMRWRDNNDPHLGQRLHELCSALGVGGDQQRHTNESTAKELHKFLDKLLDALFQIATMPSLQRSVFDALAYICHFCEQLPHLKSDLEQYIQCMHSPDAYQFILHHIIWYIESEGSDALCISSASAAFHDKLMTTLGSLGPLVRLAIASKRCVELIGNSSPKEREQDENILPQHHYQQQFKQHMDRVLTAIRQLLMGPGRRITCQNLALNQLASSILGPMAVEEEEECGIGIYEPIHLARYAIEVLDSLSEGILMGQKLHFIGQLIETELFARAECRRLLLCRCLDELVSLMPPHAREEAPCIAHYNSMHRSRSRSECSLSGAALASAGCHDSSNSANANITLLESVQQSARILANLSERLFFPNRVGNGTFAELQLILRKCFRPLNQTMVTLLGDPTHQRTLHALLLEFLDKFSAQHFDAYFGSLSNQLERLDTLSEMLHMFRDLLVRCPVPTEWRSLRRVQLRLFAKHLRLAAALCRRDFGTPAHFDAAIWCECILSCVTLAKCCATAAGGTPTAATTAGDGGGTIHSRHDDSEEEEEEWEAHQQQEHYGLVSIDDEQQHIDKAHEEEKLSRYATEILRTLWFSLMPDSKCQLMPHITGPLLEMAFAATHLCEFAVTIFVDMLTTELQMNSTDAVVVVRRRRKEEEQQQQQQQQLFSDVFINRLDPLLDFSLADAPFGTFCKVFSRAFQRHCLEQSVPDKQFEFRSFAQTVDRLLELFAAYRSVQHGTGDEMAEMGMFYTAQLVDFYQSIEHHELYVLYLYKLYTLHRTIGNWVEAGLTLKRHADLLRWSVSHRPHSFLSGTARTSGGAEFGTELELKEHIYKEMADLFTRGEHWELAIETNRELANIHETATFDYAKLAELLARNAALYEKVTKTLRMESHYFMMAFFGKNCPAHLADRKFVVRGRPLEQWGCFKQRLMANFPDFHFVDTLDTRGDTLRESDGKFLQIVPISPVPLREVYAKLLLNSPSRLASWYYRHHRVQHFELVRREFRADTKWTRLDDSETTRLWLHKRTIQIQRPLPDLLSLGPVVSEMDQEPLNPVEVAIEKMREANDKLADTAAMVGEGFAQSVVNLAGMIRGIVQADVGGGVRNYQPFFSEESHAMCTEEERHAVGTLKRLILEQTSLLEYALLIHSQNERAQANAIFHNSLVGSFMEHRQRVERWLGPVKAALPANTSIYMLEEAGTTASAATERHASHQHQQGGGMDGSGRQATATSAPQPLVPPPQMAQQQQKVARMTSMMHGNGTPTSSNTTTTNQQKMTRPASMGSAASGSPSSSSSNLFKSSTLGAALLKTTIQAKSKLKQKAGRKSSAVGICTTNPTYTAPTAVQRRQQQMVTGHEFLSSISQARQSDTSMDTFLMETEPPLPPRLSKAHSEQTVVAGTTATVT